jgi:DNA-binding NarL/FixJ family response regulator
MSVRVLVADDHARFRAMIADLLVDEGYDVCWQAATAEAAVEGVEFARPDVALLDIRMPGNGIAAARRISAADPSVRILMLTVSDVSDDVLDALQAGAHGYVLKGAPSEEILAAVAAVHEGASVIAPPVAPIVFEEIRRARDRYLRTPSGSSVRLTDREWHILEALDRGESTTAIAAEMFVAPVTIRSHIAALARKLGVRDRHEATELFAAQRSVAAPPR